VPPRCSRQLVKGDKVRPVGVTATRRFVRQIPDVRHQDRADRVNCVVPIETLGEQSSERSYHGSKAFRELVLDHHMGDGVRFYVGQFDPLSPMMLANNRQTLVLVQGQPRSGVRSNRGIVPLHVRRISSG
jgi:hypothetical protein